jgi:hypothetical protein
VLLEIFKENLRLRGISIDEPQGESQSEAPPAEAGSAEGQSEPQATDRVQRPASPLDAQAPSPVPETSTVELQQQRGEP